MSSTAASRPGVSVLKARSEGSTLMSAAEAGGNEDGEETAAKLWSPPALIRHTVGGCRGEGD